jgi:hypothetical protein
MCRSIDLLDLTPDERAAASQIVSMISRAMPWERVEAVFASIARAEWLIVPHSETLQRALPMQSATLMRNERVWATSIVLSLNLHFGNEETAEKVITFLAQRGAALDAVLNPPAAPPLRVIKGGEETVVG